MAAEEDELRSLTPARIGVSRAGTRPLTATLLQLRADHAAAVDSVYGEVTAATLDAFGWFEVGTEAAADKTLYVKRPDLGRRLRADAARVISERCVQEPQVQIVVSDGLSAQSIEANIRAVYPALLESLRERGLGWGTTFFVRGGRVGVMDPIGELLRPECLVLLIGERPGLATAESLSAYMCYRPRLGRTDADRMVVSNIHRDGLPPEEAGACIGLLAQQIIEQQASGFRFDW